MVRGIFSKKVPFSMVMIAFFYYVSFIQLLSAEEVCSLYVDVSTSAFSVLAYVFCAVPFSTAFCEDMEHGYVKQVLIRSRKWKYVLSKLSACFVSAVITFFGGNLLFIFIESMRYPFVDISGNYFDSPLGGREMVRLFQSGHYVLYLVIKIFVSSLWGGVLASVAACVSLYLKNKMAVICTPMLVHYFGGNFIRFYLDMPNRYNPMYVYDIFSDIMKGTGKSILYAVGYTLVLLVLLYVICLRKIRRDYR